MKNKCDHSAGVTIFLDHGDKLLKMIETIWLIKTLHPKYGKLSRIQVLITLLTIITSCRFKSQDATLIQNEPQAKERAITDKMLNSERERADLISIDQTTALVCASVLTRARY